MSTRDILQRAREILADPTHWTYYVAARNAFGSPVAFDAPDACMWCAAGAIQLACLPFDRDWPARFHPALEAFAHTVGGKVAVWNDAPSRTHADVLAAFDAAIAAAS